MGDIKRLTTLEADIAGLDPVGRAYTPEMLADLIRSVDKTGGTLNINKGTSPDRDVTLAAGWNRIDVWETSRDTQGVQDGLADVPPAGRFQIKSNANVDASGDYSVSAHLRFTVDTDGLYEIRAEKVESDEITITDTLWQDAVTMTAGTQEHVVIQDGLIKTVLGGEYLQLSIKGPNGAVVTINYGQFGVQR